MPTYVIAALLTIATAALAFSVYLSVIPRPAGLRTALPPVRWHLMCAGLASACAILAAGCVVAVVLAQPF